MQKKYLLISIVIIISLSMNSCQVDPTSPVEKNKYTNVITGIVVLENQEEHSNALIYLDSLNRGVCSDSNGNYKILFNEEDSVYNGEFKIRYFLNDYDMDSAKIMLIRGKVKLDTLDVNGEGKIQTKEMKQIVRVEGWTDKQEYKIGDTIKFTARFTNMTDRTVHIFIYSIFNQLGYVSLYNDKYMPFSLSPCDPVSADLEIDLHSGYYEGTVKYRIRDRYYCANGEPFLSDEYIVVTDLFIEDRRRSPYSVFENFIFFEWYKLHRGNTPQLDLFPNKYQFPHIRIIQ
ncbi:MAG: hypothetical protein AB1521_16295 [Bacteroidota bacterium]